jgi:hypothetical protein
MEKLPKDFKHTPGPWHACHDGNCSCGMVWSKSQDTLVATAMSSCRKNETYNMGEGLQNTSEAFKANTKLIAAAPELLEALARVKESFQQYAKHRKDKGTANAKINAWNNLVFHMDKVDRAIKKATE